MKKFFIQSFMTFTIWLIRMSGGRIGGKKVLILHTTGRKSGKLRAVPISYFRDGETIFILGSNWAQEKHASWYFNLKDNPHVTLEVNAEKFPALAHECEGEEYARMWEIAIEHYPHYIDYQKKIERQIPIIGFKRV